MIARVTSVAGGASAVGISLIAHKRATPVAKVAVALELHVARAASPPCITHAAAMSADALATAVRETLAEAAASGAEMTARNVRHAVEKKLGLPPDGLLDRKEELMGIISHATGKSSWA